ncbi:MAG: PAS domain-containing protein [Planctomycetota bacterium]|jgi:PAS domain S-box-containing protein
MDSIIAAHEQVRQTLRYLTVIPERTREGVVVIDFNETVWFVNTVWAVIHGYESRGELIGKHISIFHTKEQMKTDVIPFIEEVKRRGQLAGPIDHVRRNGTPFPTDTLMVVFKDQAGKAVGLIGFAADLTEHERSKGELRQYCNRRVELLKWEIDELNTANEQLQHEITEHKQIEQDPQQQTAGLLATNQRLQNQICEHERMQNELQELRDQLELRLKEQSDELTAANEQLQCEITTRKQVEEYLRQQTDELKATTERLRVQINELSARGHIRETDLSKAMGSLETYRKAALEGIFRENIRLQKPELDDAVANENTL